MKRSSFATTLKSSGRAYITSNFIRFTLLLLPFLIIAAVILPSCKSDIPKDMDETEIKIAKDSIMATIEKETKCFFARDYFGWRSTYAETDYDFQAWSNKDGTYDANVGWKAIDNSIGKYITENPEPQSSHPIVERKNIMYKFYGHNLAFLTWDQFNSTREGKDFYNSKEIRLMEKIGRSWKIVCVSAFWDYVNMIPASKLSEIQRMEKESRGSSKDKLQ